MAVFTKIEGFVKQISIFLEDKQYQKAYSLSNEMQTAFPSEMISHFLLAKSAFWLEKYEETIVEGLKAQKLSQYKSDAATCVVLTSSAYFMLEKYDEGYALLKNFDSSSNYNVKKLLLLFSAVLGEEKSAEKYARELLKLNKASAEDLISRFLKESG